jgi:hypothetical protein
MTGASLSGATRSSQRRAGISHKSINAGMGSSVCESRWRYCDCFSLRELPQMAACVTNPCPHESQLQR